MKCIKKNLESFSLYRRKKYHDPLSSLFVSNFKMFHGVKHKTKPAHALKFLKDVNSLVGHINGCKDSG